LASLSLNSSDILPQDSVDLGISEHT
jgi:hypothetical protein